MSTPPSLEDQLAADLRRSLLPHPFAPRRDLELAGVVRDREPMSCFFDAFWPAEGRLALVVARVHRGGMAGALRAGCLQRLARGALALVAGPDAALGMVREQFGREFAGEAIDLLLATLDTASGRLAHAGHGSGFVVAPAGDIDHDAGRHRVTWLICRDGAIDPARLPDAGEELGAAARSVAELAGPGSAVLGLLHRGRRRPGPDRTFAMPNDLGAISHLTGAVEAALAAAEVPEAVGAAFGLALDELLTNVVSYGYADGGRHEILVDLSIEAEAVEVRLRDDGRPFDPLRLPEPDLTSDIEDRQVGGLGIYFVRQSMDAVDYARETGWNVLRLRKGFARNHVPTSPGDRD